VVNEGVSKPYMTISFLQLICFPYWRA
jgi:hypothetical protein